MNERQESGREEPASEDRIKKELSGYVFGHIPVYLVVILAFLQVRRASYAGAAIAAYLIPLRLLLELVPVRMKPFSFVHWGLTIVLAGVFMTVRVFTGEITVDFVLCCVELLTAIGILIWGIVRWVKTEW